MNERRVMRRFENIIQQNVRSIIPKKKICLIQTETDQWVGKKLRSPKHWLWWNEIAQELYGRSFTSMPTLRSDGREWLVSRYIAGKPCDYSKREQALEAMKVLAAFHVAGQNLETPPLKRSAFLLCCRLHHRLAQYYQVLQQPIYDELSPLLQQFGYDYYQYGRKVLNQLVRLPLKSLVSQSVIVHQITHRDLASHNWIMDDRGRPWLIDFDTADYDARIGDVWQMSSRILTEKDWPVVLGKELIFTYHEKAPLTLAERKILALLWYFPNELYREVIGIRLRKPGYHISRSYPYIKKVIHQRKEWLDFQNQLHGFM